MEFYKVREELGKGRRITDLPLRVTYYARVSSETDEQLNSLGNQVDYFEEYIRENKIWTYVKGYVDEGISGSSVKNRKNFLKMIEDAKRGMFDLIITKEVSRFSRNLMDSIKYTQELLLFNVGVFFKSNDICTFDLNSEFLLNMMASVAQEEVKRLSERVKFGHRSAIKKGRVLGSSRITGYKKDNAKLVIVPEEAKFVKQVYELYATGQYGFYKLALKLKELGYLNLKGKIYDKATLTRIIENPKYKGYYRGRTTETVDYKTKKRIYLSEEQWVMFKDENIPPIVSEELWERANDLLKARGESFKNPNNNKMIYNKYAYSGKIYCFEHNATYQRSTGSRTKNRPIWACGDYLRYRLSACDSPIIAECDLDNIFKGIMATIFTNKQRIVEEMSSYYSNLKTDDSYANEIKKLNEEVVSLNEKKDKLLELCIEKRISNEELETRNNKFNEEIINIKKKVARIEAEQRIINSNFKNISIIEDKIKEQLEFKDNIYDFVTTFVDEIIVSKINGDRKDIQLDIYLNFSKKYDDNTRGAKHLKKDIPAIKYLSDIELGTLETTKRSDFKMNKFKYNVYINQE